MEKRKAYAYYEERSGRELQVEMGKRLNFPSHLHGELELFLVQSGCVCVGIDGEFRELKAGELAVVLPNTVQAQRKALLLLAMSGAFIFVISSLKIPSVTGSCSHMTGTGLAAILFGPAYAAVLGLIVLVFQAVLLAHGGLTTLGANTFSMAIAGPLVSWGVYALCKKARVNRKLAIFLAASLGDLFTYCVTSLQLAMAYPAAEGGAAASAVRFLGVFAPTQLPLAAIEGILTVLVVMGLESCARPELREIGFLKEGLQ